MTGLVLIAVALLLMRGLEPGSSWTHLLPGFVDGHNAVFAVAAATAGAGAAIAWPLLGEFAAPPSRAVS